MRDVETLGQLHLRPSVIRTEPSARTVLVDGGVPFPSAIWVTAVVRSAPDRIAAGLRRRFPGLIPARPIVPTSSAADRGLVNTIALQRRHIQLNGAASFRWLPHDIDHAGSYFATAMPTCPSPISSPSIPRTATGIVPCFWQCLSAGTLQQASNLCIFTARLSAGIARRISADRHYSALISKNPVHPQPSCTASTANNGIPRRSLARLACWLPRTFLQIFVRRDDNCRIDGQRARRQVDNSSGVG